MSAKEREPFLSEAALVNTSLVLKSDSHRHLPFVRFCLTHYCKWVFKCLISSHRHFPRTSSDFLLRLFKHDSPDEPLSIELENLRNLHNEIFELNVDDLLVHSDENVDQLFVAYEKADNGTESAIELELLYTSNVFSCFPIRLPQSCDLALKNFENLSLIVLFHHLLVCCRRLGSAKLISLDLNGNFWFILIFVWRTLRKGGCSLSCAYLNGLRLREDKAKVVFAEGEKYQNHLLDIVSVHKGIRACIGVCGMFLCCTLRLGFCFHLLFLQDRIWDAKKLG